MEIKFSYRMLVEIGISAALLFGGVFIVQPAIGAVDAIPVSLTLYLLDQVRYDMILRARGRHLPKTLDYKIAHILPRIVNMKLLFFLSFCMAYAILFSINYFTGRDMCLPNDISVSLFYWIEDRHECAQTTAAFLFLISATTSLCSLIVNPMGFKCFVLLSTRHSFNWLKGKKVSLSPTAVKYTPGGKYDVDRHYGLDVVLIYGRVSQFLFVVSFLGLGLLLFTSSYFLDVGFFQHAIAGSDFERTFFLLTASVMAVMLGFAWSWFIAAILVRLAVRHKMGFVPAVIRAPGDEI